jgi:hypothetical protein
MAIALVALVVACAGGGIAAGVKITSADIKDGTIRAADLSPSLRAQINAPGPRGARGPQGIQGAQGIPGPLGATGPAGTFSAANVTEVPGPLATANILGSGSSVATSTATCPPGSALLGGGYINDSNSFVDGTTADSGPLSANAWSVIIVNNATVAAVSFHAVAFCGHP